MCESSRALVLEESVEVIDDGLRLALRPRIGADLGDPELVHELLRVRFGELAIAHLFYAERSSPTSTPSPADLTPDSVTGKSRASLRVGECFFFFFFFFFLRRQLPARCG